LTAQNSAAGTGTQHSFIDHQPLRDFSWQRIVMADRLWGFEYFKLE